MAQGWQALCLPQDMGAHLMAGAGSAGLASRVAHANRASRVEGASRCFYSPSLDSVLIWVCFNFNYPNLF